MVRRNHGINEFTTFLELGKSSLLILAHETAIADHIGRKDGSHSALNAIPRHAKSRFV